MSGTLQNKRKIREGEPITCCGLTIYPIRMDFYEDFLACRDAICLRLSSLPAKYAVKDFLSAVFAMEIDARKQEGSPGAGLFGRVLRFLILSLQLDPETLDVDEMIRYRIENNEIGIEHFLIPQGDTTVTITPAQFSGQIRQVLAELNGLKLPNEAENADLVADYELKKQILNRGKAQLDQNTDDLIASVAYLSGIRERDILTWTVREFELRRRAIDRDKNHAAYGAAELSGMVTFKSGNPYPSWCFDAVDDSLGTVDMPELQKNISGAAPSPEIPKL